jgi:hypothetical protein
MKTEGDHLREFEDAIRRAAKVARELAVRRAN